MGLWDQPNFNDIVNFLNFKEDQGIGRERLNMMKDLHELKLQELLRGRNIRARETQDPLVKMQKERMMRKMKEEVYAPSSPAPNFLINRPENTWENLNWVSAKTGIEPEKFLPLIMQSGRLMQGRGEGERPAGGDPYGGERTNPYGYGSGYDNWIKRIAPFFMGGRK